MSESGEFRGGKQSERDRAYGITDQVFWDWWHRIGKRQAGGGDIANREQAEAIYREWVELGRPRAPKGRAG